MALDAPLRAVLLAVCPRVSADFAQTSEQRPYVTYQQIGGQVINPLDNSSPGRRNATVQINVFANTRPESIALSEQIEDAMRAATTFIAQPLSAAFADFDFDMKVYSAQQDFSLWL